MILASIFGFIPVANLKKKKQLCMTFDTFIVPKVNLTTGAVGYIETINFIKYHLMYIVINTDDFKL